MIPLPGALAMIGLVLLGAALQAAIKIVYARRGGDNLLRTGLSILAWLLLCVGLLGCFTLVVGPFGIPLWLAAPLVGVMAVARYRRNEQRMLLWTLAHAARRGVPLHEAADAFADERTDGLGMKAARLAELLREGAPLPRALEMSGNRLPVDAALAVRVGSETNDLAAAMEGVLAKTDEQERLLRGLLEKFFYLLVVITFASGVLTFILIKIVPTFAVMFEEFGLDLPYMTVLLIEISAEFLTVSVLLLPLQALLLLAFLLGGLYYMGLLPADLPLLGRFWLRLDGALIMKTLAAAIRRQRGVPPTLEMLAVVYPESRVRRLLAQAATASAHGGDWRDALRRAGLIGQADAGVLLAAERVGNLSWALDEMAEGYFRRLNYRLRVWFTVLFPIVLLALGATIGYVVIALFLPLASLINGLS